MKRGIIKWTSLTFLGIVFLSLSTMQLAQAQVTATVSIEATCGAAPGGDIAFDDGADGPIAPWEISAEETLSITNGGTTDAIIGFSGTDWTQNAVTFMDVGETKYAVPVAGPQVNPTIAYANKINLTGVDTAAGNITADTTNDTYWQLQASLSQTGVKGGLTQTITITATC